MCIASTQRRKQYRFSLRIKVSTGAAILPSMVPAEQIWHGGGALRDNCEK